MGVSGQLHVTPAFLQGYKAQVGPSGGMDALDGRRISASAGARTLSPQLFRLCQVTVLTGLSQIVRELNFVSFHVIQVDRDCY
jgi:hypothetical protein